MGRSSSPSPSESRVARLASVTGSVLVTSVLSRKRLWIGPAATGLLILAVGWWTHQSVENAVRTNLSAQLKTLLRADVAALEFWIQTQRSRAEGLASDSRVQQPTRQLKMIKDQAARDSVPAELLSSPALRQLREYLGTWLTDEQWQGFMVLDSKATVIAGDMDIGIGDPTIARSYQKFLEPTFVGESMLILPLPSSLLVADADGNLRAGVPVMYAVAPIRADDDSVVAALCLRIRPEAEFTEILRVARAGESGETYAFNESGTLVTNSRFDDELKRIGLLSDTDSARSLLNIQIRDPGVDMTKGLRPTERRPNQPLTRMAIAALEGTSGVDVNGYRDYRGVEVVGAWTWLRDYRIAVATEVDAAEAFRPLATLRAAFGAITALLLATTLGLWVLTYYASNLERQARRSALEAKRLGQYALDQQIGAGGMGVVYRAHHDMLHRPTAIKLLHVDKTDESAIARFEREVQLTSQLTHPNTIAIYDYGRTPEGVFYYVMEYLDGITLDHLVESFGPQPEGRVIAILRQLCGSLSEAHGLGLIHRDIKPANIMLTKTGGMHDFVKLLDFGLVKPEHSDQNVTMDGSLTGTPLYLSPEAIRHANLDARSDLYAVGAVGYFLLTGQPVFHGRSILDVCRQHQEADPETPTKRLGQPVSDDLTAVLLHCLAKNPADRPATAETLDDALSQCDAADTWSHGEAKRWWSEHLDTNLVNSETMTSQSALTATIIAAKPKS